MKALIGRVSRFFDLPFLFPVLAVVGATQGIRLIVVLNDLAKLTIDLSVIGYLFVVWGVQYSQAISKVWKEIKSIEDWVPEIAGQCEALGTQMQRERALLNDDSKTSELFSMDKYLLVLKRVLLGKAKEEELKTEKKKVTDAIYGSDWPAGIRSRFIQYQSIITRFEKKLIQQRDLRLPGRTYFFLRATALITTILALFRPEIGSAGVIAAVIAFFFTAAMLLLQDADGPYEESEKSQVYRLGVNLDMLGK